ncbi:hypothetical protein KJ972_04850 [Candidatus Micrarchaeota archaeon]|nr:hypothetical protein [Candidatus Micrarchaeota archaeon]
MHAKIDSESISELVKKAHQAKPSQTGRHRARKAGLIACSVHCTCRKKKTGKTRKKFLAVNRRLE